MKPRRSVLSVPGHAEKMHKNAANSQADVILLDLEDSVPLDAKEQARNVVVNSIRNLDWKKKTVTARINGLDTSFGYQDLLVLAEKAGHRLDAVVVPKVDHCKDIHFVSRMLDGVELSMGFSNRIGIEAIIESAGGLASVSEIAQSSQRLKTLVFGVADYSASIGARLVSISGHGEKEEDIYPGHRWNFAISRMVMAAKARGILAIDAPYGNFKDLQGLKRSAIVTCALGCDGKWAIHPGQIEIINEVFSPSSDDIERARKILQAYEKAEAEGRGAASLEGRMIDQATVRLARRLWQQAEYLKMI